MGCSKELKPSLRSLIVMSQDELKGVRVWALPSKDSSLRRESFLGQLIRNLIFHSVLSLGMIRSALPRSMAMRSSGVKSRAAKPSLTSWPLR